MIKLISDYLRKEQKLEALCQAFSDCFKVVPVIGVEIEFYVSDDNTSQILSQLPYIQKEKADLQYEIALEPEKEILFLEAKIDQSKYDLCKLTNYNITFEPKPYKNNYGNSMHFHVNFLRTDGTNLFNEEMRILRAAQGLCHFMQQTFLVFAQNEAEHLRFDPYFLAPAYVCFGNNNRTVAVRIPSTLPRRLEHRLANPNTDVYVALFVILKSFYIAFKNPTIGLQYHKIYGNAFDQQYQTEPYNLQRLPTKLRDSRNAFNLNFFEIPIADWGNYLYYL